MGDAPADNRSLDALKTLLLAPEARRIQSIEDRLDDPIKRAAEISNALPDAIAMSVSRTDGIAKVLHPVIDTSLKESVKHNPKALADAIFPALGPGIRKAISATIMGMIQSLNQVLNHSFSAQGLKWRFEAFKTRRPFAEIVLLNTLVYQVEQIFLIHKETGIVLEHVVGENAFAQDPDLVSGMLTAILDFVRDSFQTDTGDELDTLRMGSSRSVWIEKGEHALIAAVIRGTPPMELRTEFRAFTEDIHLKAGTALGAFDGDPTPFAVFREPLKDKLKSQEKQEDKKTSPLLWVMGAFIVLIILSAGLLSYRHYSEREARLQKAAAANKAFQTYLGELQARPGILPTTFRRLSDNRFELHGLLDPMVPVPEPSDAEKQLFAVAGRWQPYYSLEPDLVLKRAKKVLSPPATVTLALKGSTLTVSGTADQTWQDRFRVTVRTLPGITRVSADRLRDPHQAQSQRTREMFRAYLARLDSQKGVVTVSHRELSDNTFEIKGLKDPLARLPGLTEKEKQRLGLTFIWQPYYSLEPELVLKRAHNHLSPPPGVTLDLSGDTLAASGRAGQDWIDAFRRLAPVIPGVTQISDQNLINTDREHLSRALARLKTHRIYFNNNRTTLVPGQEAVIRQITETLARISRLQEKTRIRQSILIRGHADPSGSEKNNLRLSRERAQTVYDMLTDGSLRPGLLGVAGLGTKIILDKGTDPEARQANRAVTFATGGPSAP